MPRSGLSRSTSPARRDATSQGIQRTRCASTTRTVGVSVADAPAAFARPVQPLADGRAEPLAPDTTYRHHRAEDCQDGLYSELYAE